MNDARALVPPVDDAAAPTGSLPDVDRFHGCLLGVGIGDALGRPVESRTPEQIRSRYGSLRDYVPWRGYQGGPLGTITDDTQMTMCVAEAIVAHGRLDPDDLAQRFVDWLPQGRGKGATCTAAVTRLVAGADWTTSGVASAGNGAAMRVAPVGLLHVRRPGQLRRDAALSAVITHADPMAVVSAVAQAAAVAYLTTRPAGGVDVAAFLAAIDAAIGDLPDPGSPERKPGATRPVRLHDRLRELPDLLHLDADAAFAYLYNGGFVLESLPAAWWCFLREPDDPERAIVTAVNAGYDADTVASMVGALSGAYHGVAGFPQRWVRDLEYRDELLALATRLWELAGDGSVQATSDALASGAVVESASSGVAGSASARDDVRVAVESGPTLRGLEVGAPLLTGPLTLLPLFAPGPAPDDYLTGAELGPDVLALDESGTGSVPELLVTNLAPKPLLLLEGETITGNRQDRVLNVSVLIGTGGPRPIPVSCVEAGRWGAKAAARRSERHVPLMLKRQLAEDVHRSKRSRGERHSDQGAVWAHVARLSAEFEAHAPTSSYHDVERVARARTTDLVGGLEPLADQVGVVVAIAGEVVALEVFDSPRSLGAHWDSLVHGYAVDAVGTAQGQETVEATVALDEARAFAALVARTDCDATGAVDLGEELNATTADVAISGLRWNGRIVHLAAFARPDQEPVGVR